MHRTCLLPSSITAASTVLYCTILYIGSLQDALVNQSVIGGKKIRKEKTAELSWAPAYFMHLLYVRTGRMTHLQGVVAVQYISYLAYLR